jgi:hypothetical protein
MKSVAAMAVAVAVMLAPAGSGAQTSPPAASQGIRLTLEQRHVIRELVKDTKVEQAPVDSKLAPGDAVPESVESHPLPKLIGEKVPQIRSHRFFVTPQQIVIVDPKQPKVTVVIE